MSSLRTVRRWCSSTIRPRSAWDRVTLSYTGRNRMGAGVSAAGRGASGGRTAPALPRRGTLDGDWAEPVEHLGRGGEPGPEGPRPPRGERGEVAEHRLSSHIGGQRTAQPRLDRRPARLGRCHRARGGTWTTGTRKVTAWARAAESAVGNWGPSASRSSARVRGCSSSNRRPASTTAATSTLARARLRPNRLRTRASAPGPGAGRAAW